ncbi:unnamed protein product, partial [Didymodactylos carnosus]
MIIAGFQDRSTTHRRESITSAATTTNSSQADDTDIVLKNALNLNQAEVIAGLALELLKNSKNIINPITKQPFRVKFGFHSGSAVGGIVGNKNFQYCLFGDTVNTASRVTTSGDVGKIHVSDTSHELLQASQYFDLAFRGKTEMKGKGMMSTYWLTGAKPAYLSQMEVMNELTEKEEGVTATMFQQTMYSVNTNTAPPPDEKERTISTSEQGKDSPDKPSTDNSELGNNAQESNNKPVPQKIPVAKKNVLN